MVKIRRRPLVLAAVLLCAGAFAVSRFATVRASAVQTVRATIAVDLVARAVVQSRTGIAEVRARQSGRVARVLVQDGDEVQSGQLLAELEDPRNVQELVRAQAQQRALTELASSTADGLRVEQRGELEADLSSASQESRLASQRAEEDRKLFESGAISERDMRQSASSAKTATARADAARWRVLSARKGRRGEIEAARARAAAAAAEAARAQAEVDDLRLFAPVSGRIVARRIDAGDTILADAASVLFEISDATNLEIRAELEEQDASRIQIGTPAALALRERSTTVATARVTRMGARLEARAIDADDARVRATAKVRPVWLTCDDGCGGLILGQRIEAVLHLGPRTVDAAVPREAIVVRDGQTFVRTIRGAWVEEKLVELGVADARLVEVTGLSATERVLRAPWL